MFFGWVFFLISPAHLHARPPWGCIVRANERAKLKPNQTPLANIAVVARRTLVDGGGGREVQRVGHVNDPELVEHDGRKPAEADVACCMMRHAS